MSLHAVGVGPDNVSDLLCLTADIDFYQFPNWIGPARLKCSGVESEFQRDMSGKGHEGPACCLPVESMHFSVLQACLYCRHLE